MSTEESKNKSEDDILNTNKLSDRQIEIIKIKRYIKSLIKNEDENENINKIQSKKVINRNIEYYQNNVLDVYWINYNWNLKPVKKLYLKKTKSINSSNDFEKDEIKQTYIYITKILSLFQEGINITDKIKQIRKKIKIKIVKIKSINSSLNSWEIYWERLNILLSNFSDLDYLLKESEDNEYEYYINKSKILDCLYSIIKRIKIVIKYM